MDKIKLYNTYIYIILINDIIYGCYDDYILLDIQLKGLIQKNIIRDTIIINIYNKNSFNCILSYKYNSSIIKEDIKNIKEDIKNIKEDIKNIKEDAEDTKEDTCDIKEDTDDVKEDNEDVEDDIGDVKEDTEDIKKDIFLNNLLDEKQKLRRMQNVINNEKKELINKKDIYANDIKLYTLFSKKIKEDDTFIIPEIFIIKFNIMKDLDYYNNLSFDTFHSAYY